MLPSRRGSPASRPRLALTVLMVGLSAGVDVSCTEELATAAKSEDGGNVVIHGVIGSLGAVTWGSGNWTVVGEATLIDAEWTFESSSTAVVLLRFEGGARRAMTSRNGSLWVDRCRFGRNSGGGIHVVLGTATIRNTIFEDNGDTRRGGGALIEGVASIVTCIFRRNTASEGGAIWFSSSSGGELAVYNSSFVGNRAIRGGAASCSSAGSLLTIANSSFIRNQAIAPRMSGLPAMGGALYVGGNLSAKVVHSAFRENKARPDSLTASGGCLSGQGGAIAALGVASLVCWSSRFEENHALSGPSSSGAQGGAVYLAYSRRDVSFKDCLFARNEASGRSAETAVDTGGGAAGGGLSIAYSLPAFEHCRFEANVATGGPNDPSRGGAARLVDADSNFVDCIFFGNEVIGYTSSSSYFSSGAFGGAIAIEASKPVFRGTAFYDNRAVAEQRADAHDLIVALQRGNRVIALLSSVGGAVHATSASAPFFEECTFQNNEAELSGHDIAATGGIYSPYTSLLNATTAVGLFNCSFAGLHEHSYQRPWRRLAPFEEENLDITRFDSRFVESAAKAVARARVVALGATVDVDDPVADDAIANLQVVVIGEADWLTLWRSLDATEACLDAKAIWQLSFQERIAQKSVRFPFPAGVRAASRAFSHNSSLSVLALWADIVLGIPNQIGRGMLSELILVGGHLLLRSNTTTVHGSIVLDDAGIVGMDRRTPAVLRLSSESLGLSTSYSSSVVGRVFDRFTDGMSSDELSGLSHRRGKLVLYGATIDFADGELRLDDARLDLIAGARWILRKSTVLTLAGRSEVFSDHATIVICNGTVRRTSATSDLSLLNATFLHNGILSYNTQNVLGILQPPLDAWRVLPGQSAMVTATLDPDIQVSYSSRWLIYRQHNHSERTAAQTAIAGAGNGIGLRLEDSVDEENRAVLEAHVDYVDCEARVVGRLLPDDDKTDSNGKESYADHADRESFEAVNTSNAFSKAVVGVREQCALCLGNSSCGFSHTAARDADKMREDTGLVYIADIAVCVTVARKSSNNSSDYSYRSANCCEYGCSTGGSCVKGRCRCTWWWSGSRCSALSLKARMFITLCASALLAVAGVIAYIVLWKQRKSRAIGQVLDELRQNLLDVDAYDEIASDLTPAVDIPAEEVRPSAELSNDDPDDIWRSWSPAMSASMLTAASAARNDADDAAEMSPRQVSRRNGYHLPFRRSRSMNALFESKTATRCSTPPEDERQRDGFKCESGQGRAQQKPNTICNFGNSREHGDDAGVYRRRQPRSSSIGLFSFGGKKCGDGAAISGHNRAAGNSETQKLINADYVRDLRQRMMLRDVLIRREELDMHDRIGSGAFGDVYRATYRGCDVAVKKLKIANFVHDDATLIEEVDRFRSEAVLMARLRHPNVLMILGVVVDDDDENRAYFASLSRAPYFRSQEARNGNAISNDAGHQKRRRSTARHDMPSVAPPPLLALSIVTEFLALQALADLLYDEATYNPALHFQQGPPRAVPLPPEAWSYELVLLCAIQAARGMLYLHLRNPPICHRDLKCANLMVDEHWRVKIGDYGLSRFVCHRPSRLRDEAPPDAPVDEALAVNVAKPSEHFMTADLGTLRWRAPETFGRGRRMVSYSTKADVYSFGCCLLELYNRKPPWADLSSRFDITDAILAGELQTLEPPAPPAFTVLLNTCMALDPAMRPNFGQIVSDLDAELRRARADATGAPDHPSLRTLALANGNGLPRLCDGKKGKGGSNPPTTSVDSSDASSRLTGPDTI